MDERRQRAAEAVRESGADWGVLTSADAVCYASGHVVPIEAGASPFAGGPTTVLLAADGTLALIAANVEKPEQAGTDHTASYVGYAFDTPSDLVGNYLGAVDEAVQRLGVHGVLAVERASFPAHLHEHMQPTRCVDITPSLARQRATKTPIEIAALRRAAEAAAAGQRAALLTARPGISELALFAEIRLAMEMFAGERIPVTGDLLSGRARTAAFTGWPTDRTIAAADPIIADLAPRIAGYWGDSCGSFTVGACSPDYGRLFASAKGALDLALDIMRPGLPISQLDRLLRDHVGRFGYSYPHHSGHSIGTAVHEFPRVVPHETTQLATDMVLMIEPGAYDGAVGGVRTEWMIRVTATGCEPLAPFEHVASTAR